MPQIEIDHPYRPHDNQKKIHECDKRFIVINSGRRFGKSILVINEVFKRAVQNPGSYWIIAPTYRQVKAIYWRGLIGEFIPKEMVKKMNESELYIEVKTITGETSTIELKGADNPDSLRGSALDGVVFDEYAFTKPFVWEEIVEPMIREKKGWALFISTPKGFNHFWDMSEYARNPKHKEWAYFHFTSYDNPYFDKKELDKARSKASPERFAQEYMAEFTKNAGLVYQEFDKDVHVLKIDQPEPNWVKYRSIDFGQTNPTACLWVGIDGAGSLYVYDELYRTGISTSELAHLINAKSADYYTATYGDSAAAQSIKDLAEYGVYVTPIQKTAHASREDYLKAGIEKVREFLKIQEGTGKPKLFVSSRCQNLIDEFLAYSWPEVKDDVRELNKPEKPEKAYDHALDALRYFIYEYTRPQKYEQKQYEPVDELTGY